VLAFAVVSIVVLFCFGIYKLCINQYVESKALEQGEHGNLGCVWCIAAASFCHWHVIHPVPADILSRFADAVASFSVVVLSIGILVSAGQQPFLHASAVADSCLKSPNW
jgi:hypothetical protein